MDPFDVLIPDNLLVATSEPRQVPVARCECGVYGCGSTDVTIVRDGDAVHWEWHHEVPMPHGVTFPADAYDAEVARIAGDHSWERPGETIARLVLERVDRSHLAEHGLVVSWAAMDHRNDKLFTVALFAKNDVEPGGSGHQVFLRFRRGNRSPEDVAADAVEVLAQRPEKWRATWLPTTQGDKRRPALAGFRWRRERI